VVGQVTSRQQDDVIHLANLQFPSSMERGTSLPSLLSLKGHPQLRFKLGGREDTRYPFHFPYPFGSLPEETVLQTPKGTRKEQDCLLAAQHLQDVGKKQPINNPPLLLGDLAGPCTYTQPNCNSYLAGCINNAAGIFLILWVLMELS
jgi:hypothetical protein